MNSTTPRWRRRLASGTALAALGLAASMTALPANAGDKPFRFEMVRSPSLNATPNCAAHAHGTVSIEPLGPVEEMHVNFEGLPPNTGFDFFVIQQPNGPSFGMAWYQGDIESDSKCEAHGKFVGRFNEETFIVGQGSVAAPSVHQNAFPDATSNPTTGPIHTFHLGLWFNSSQDASKAGCSGNTTPFNGEHNAGVQVLNTSNFPNLEGPLLHVKP